MRLAALHGAENDPKETCRMLLIFGRDKFISELTLRLWKLIKVTGSTEGGMP
jgi:hypothetical protein